MRPSGRFLAGTTRREAAGRLMSAASVSGEIGQGAVRPGPLGGDGNSRKTEAYADLIRHSLPTTDMALCLNFAKLLLRRALSSTTRRCVRPTVLDPVRVVFETWRRPTWPAPWQMRER